MAPLSHPKDSLRLAPAAKLLYTPHWGGGDGAPPVSASFSGGHQLHLLNETYGGRPSQHWLYLAEVSHVGFHKTHLHFKINS